MNLSRLGAVCAMLVLTLPSRCFSMADYLVLQLEKRFQPIIDRVGRELRHTAWPGPMVYELRHRGVETTPEGKELGPTKGGFVLVAGTIEDLASFKPPQYPFNWEG